MPRTSHELRLGYYRTPEVAVGGRLHCAVRGEVIVVGMSNGRIPWPLASKPGNTNRMLVIYGDLKRAVTREAAITVCHHWGVTPQTVSKWRKAMGVGPHTDGSRELRRSHGLRKWLKIKDKVLAKAGDPERCEKIAAAKYGKKRPPHVIEACGRRISAARSASRTGPRCGRRA